jgi:hypothetical protein
LRRSATRRRRASASSSAAKRASAVSACAAAAGALRRLVVGQRQRARQAGEGRVHQRQQVGRHGLLLADDVHEPHQLVAHEWDERALFGAHGA